MGGMELILIMFADPPTVKLLTATTPPPFNAGIVSVASLRLKLRIGNPSEPAVLETMSVPPALTLMVLLPPPARMELAWTLPPLRLSVPVIKEAEPGLVSARLMVLFTLTNAPPAPKRPLLLTLNVPVAMPFMLVA